MSADIPDWSRPYFKNASGSPMLFYVVYGSFPEAPTVSASRYRCSGIPAEIEMMSYGPQVEPGVVESFRSGYLWDRLQIEDPSLASSVQGQDQCIVVRGELEDRETLNDLRNVVGFLTYLLDSGCVAIFDPQMFQWWSPQDWRESVFAAGSFSPWSHVVILASEDGPGTVWLHTRGMRKFGRPDLSMRSVPIDRRDACVQLINRFIEYQALGGTIAEAQEIRMAGLPDGLKCFHRGDYDDPDFNNLHVEISA